ncbi:Cupin superfamily protein [Caballeronia pedi]|uniref:Cupin superfamily protein n=1 Tax=Caballeronia pedi TaxID=1777141 RepID=A0A158C8Q7_9BURK|nr:cupin-like domain-containing protein [Caballeronia pedi]SAK78670.1 Cupin superfamily protein [Caballeronia pedi]
MAKRIVKVIDLVPGRSMELPSIDNETLGHDRFWRDFVCAQQPVVIRHAVPDWPALKKWGTPGYLEALTNREVGVSDTFNASPAGLWHQNLPKYQLDEAIARLRDAAPDDTLAIRALPIPSEWKADLGSYDFLDANRDLPPRVYARDRLFIYRNASTEWHYHTTDETLTTQILGKKRISMFRLSNEDWHAYAGPIKSNLHHMEERARFFPADAALMKFEATLDPGDVLYIPPFWWHGVDPADNGFGITLAHCFRTPLNRLGSLSDPAVKDVIRAQGSLALALRMRAFVALGSLSRIVNP